MRKFRSVEEMTGQPPLRPLDPENLRIACGLSSLERFAPVRRTPGVLRFRSIEEMSRRRDDEERKRTQEGVAERSSPL